MSHVDLTEIARLRELEAKATPGPWEAGTTALGGGLLHRPIITAPMEQLPRPFLVAESLNSAGDANLIAALRNAAPALLDAAERAEFAAACSQTDIDKRIAADTQRDLALTAKDFYAGKALEAEAERDRLAARVTALEAELALQVEAARVHLKWIDKESAGPPYPGGVRRDNGGEAIWRAWWDEQLELCALSEKLCREAVSRARALLNQEKSNDQG